MSSCIQFPSYLMQHSDWLRRRAAGRDATWPLKKYWNFFYFYRSFLFYFFKSQLFAQRFWRVDSYFFFAFIFPRVPCSLVLNVSGGRRSQFKLWSCNEVKCPALWKTIRLRPLVSTLYTRIHTRIHTYIHTHKQTNKYITCSFFIFLLFCKLIFVCCFPMCVCVCASSKYQRLSHWHTARHSNTHTLTHSLSWPSRRVNGRLLAPC